MDKIYIAIEHIEHFDWERWNVIGASHDESVCKKMIEKAEREFESFDDEHAEYWIEAVPIAKEVV